MVKLLLHLSVVEFELSFVLEVAIIARLSPIVVIKVARVANSSVDKESLKKIDIMLDKATNSLPDNFVKKSKIFHLIIIDSNLLMKYTIKYVYENGIVTILYQYWCQI